jgi:hypothetical protein
MDAGSGAQTLAATRAARGKNLAASGGRKAGAKAVTALAHQFAGLISPLHGRSPLPGSSPPESVSLTRLMPGK